MPATIKFFTDPQGPNIFKTVFQTASLPVRTPAEQPATLQPAAVRGVLPFRLQQGLSTQHRTLQQESETLGLCRTVCPVAQLEEGAPVPVGGASASLAASLRTWSAATPTSSRSARSSQSSRRKVSVRVSGSRKAAR